jgi:hypothetical protein
MKIKNRGALDYKARGIIFDNEYNCQLFSTWVRILSSVLDLACDRGLSIL